MMYRIGLALGLVSIVMAAIGALKFGYHMIPRSLDEWMLDLSTVVVFLISVAFFKVDERRSSTRSDDSDTLD